MPPLFYLALCHSHFLSVSLTIIHHHIFPGTSTGNESCPDAALVLAHNGTRELLRLASVVVRASSSARILPTVADRPLGDPSPLSRCQVTAARRAVIVGEETAQDRQVFFLSRVVAMLWAGLAPRGPVLFRSGPTSVF
jgi:hypothetical protein